jgi:hypothetical protein
MTGPRFDVFQFNPNGVWCNWNRVAVCRPWSKVHRVSLLKTVASCASWIEILGRSFSAGERNSKGKAPRRCS